MQSGRKLFQTFYDKLDIQNKIIFAIYIVLVPTIIIISAFTTYRSYRDTMDNTSEVYQRFTQNVSNDIGYIQQDVQDVCTYFVVNAQVHGVLMSSADAYSNDGLFWYNQTPISLIRDMLAIKTHIKTLILYPENGASPFYLSRDSSVQQKDLAYVMESAAYQKASQSRGDIVWIRCSKKDSSLYVVNKSDKIIAGRILYDMGKTRKIGFLAIGTDLSDYETVCRNMLQYDNEGIAVLDGEGETFADVGQVDEEVLQVLRENPDIFDLAKQKPYVKINNHYVFRAVGAQDGLRVYYMSPEANWNKKIVEGMMLPSILILILLLFSWPLSRLVSHSLSRPMKELRDAMRKFRKGDFGLQLPVTGNDEIGQISQSFNKMARETKQLIEKNYVMALREKESELNTLQAQINPHFLYNVMDSLYWQAVNDDNEKLSEEILALSKLFRLVLSKGKGQITVSREIELVSSYLQIQKMRFPKRLNYKIDVSEDIMDNIISKLMIQPFVENAVVHGLENMEQGGLIEVVGFAEGDYVHFIVKDDGVGMPEEEAEQILFEHRARRNDSSRLGGYAISNIHERMVLQYGNDFKLTIHSGIGEGTRVDLVIPRVYGEKMG